VKHPVGAFGGRSMGGQQHLCNFLRGGHPAQCDDDRDNLVAQLTSQRISDPLRP
jgi:hypothetical protein